MKNTPTDDAHASTPGLAFLWFKIVGAIALAVTALIAWVFPEASAPGLFEGMVLMSLAILVGSAR